MRRFFCLLTAVLLALVFALSGCQWSDNDTSSSTPSSEAKTLESLSEVELEDLYHNALKVPEEFGFEELKGYGRIVESASTAEEAIVQTSAHFTNDRYITAECRIEMETDYFYGIYVKCEPRAEENKAYWYEENVVCFKKSVCNFGPHVTNEATMYATNKDVVKQIFDYCYYSALYEIEWVKILHSEIQETGAYYRHVTYLIIPAFKNGGHKVEVRLFKQVIQIPKRGGEFAFSLKEAELLQTITIKGTDMGWD